MLIRPVIKVWCLPEMTEAQIQKLHKEIVKCVEDLELLSLKGEESMIVLFPRDMMSYGLGSEIYIEVNGFPPPGFEDSVGWDIALALGVFFKSYYPEAHVQTNFGNTIVR